MAGFDDFDADMTELRVEVQEAVALLCDAASELESPDRVSGVSVNPDDSVRRVLSAAPVMVERAARLIVRFERMACAIAGDFGSIDRFRGMENVAGLFSEAGRQRMRAERVRSLTLPPRLDQLLTGGGVVCSLLDEVRQSVRNTRAACEHTLERLARAAIAASNAVEDAERMLAVINSELSNLERRLGPTTGRDAAVTLAEDYARLAGERRAIIANLTSLRRLRDEDDGVRAILEPLFASLSDLVGELGCLRSKLATDLEADVLLFAAVADRLRGERIGNVGSTGSADKGNVVAEFLALQASGALSIRDIERRQTAANAAFAKRFPEPARQPEAQPRIRDLLRLRDFLVSALSRKVRSVWRIRPDALS